MHLSVRAESMSGGRLISGKPDLQLWRETFAEWLRGYGAEAEATRETARGEGHWCEPLWQGKAREDGLLRSPSKSMMSGEAYQHNRVGALQVWAHIVSALRASGQPGDRELAERVSSFVVVSTFAIEVVQQRRVKVPGQAACCNIHVQQIPHRSLNHLMPIQTLKDGSRKNPELLVKWVRDLPDFDS